MDSIWKLLKGRGRFRTELLRCERDKDVFFFWEELRLQMGKQYIFVFLFFQGNLTKFQDKTFTLIKNSEDF